MDKEHAQLAFHRVVEISHSNQYLLNCIAITCCQIGFHSISPIDFTFHKPECVPMHATFISDLPLTIIVFECRHLPHQVRFQLV